MVAAGLAFLVGSFFYWKSEVPPIRALSDYDPPQATKIFSEDGYLVAKLFKERRTVVPLSTIPKHVIHAFLAAEDANFYQHEGIDYMGIARALIKNLRPGAHLQGASTITQQTVKTLVLGPERSFSRKMREVILAREFEQEFTKDEILHMYLNQIYFGAGAYGVEEAAFTYFRKSVRELTLGEGAYLAAIPKNPQTYTLRRNPAAAKQRQKYVLEEMLQHGFATAAEVKAAIDAPVPDPKPPPPHFDVAPHYVEHVRRMLVEKYGEEVVYTKGLTVYTGMNAVQQEAAHKHLRRGLEEVTKTQGYAGASLRVEVNRLEAFTKNLHDAFNERQNRLNSAQPAATKSSTVLPRLIWDLSHFDEAALGNDAAAGAALRTLALKEGIRTKAIVSKINSAEREVLVDLGSCLGRISMKGLEWARRFSPTAATPMPRDPAEVLRKGDLIVVEVTQLGANRGKITSGSGSAAKSASLSATGVLAELSLVPEPKVQGALVAIDPHTRFVRAIVGGYDLRANGFDRATQALRQPGSAFKPLVYATGLASSAMTPASVCLDTPLAITDPWTGKVWKPENYEDGRYDGNITYRTALMRSKNICSVKLIERVGADQVVALAHSMGIHSPLPKNLTLALGTGEVTPLELTNAFATIAAAGAVAEPLFVRKVVDRHGKVMEEYRATTRQVLDPAVAYVLTRMMQSVVQGGTASRALVLDRPVAGKTGTSNESRNVWFAGFSAELVASVWVGFDDNSSMGQATGSSTALPTWIRFMGEALAGQPRRDFTAPDNVVVVKIDPQTGLPSSEPGSIDEVFVAGTAPNPQTDPLPSIFIEDDANAAP